MMEQYEQQSMTLQFLWSFDHRTGKFFLNEHAFFSFSTIKTKIIFYFTQKHGKTLDQAEKFINDLYFVSKSLSMRPKFQLILISLSYMAYSALTNVVLPVFKEQCEIPNYFTNVQKNLLEEKNSRKFILLQLMKILLVHFDLHVTFDVLKDLVPRAVEMELFILSDSSKGLQKFVPE